MSTVKDIKRTIKQKGELLTIKANASIAEAAKKMSDTQVGCLVVLGMQDEFVGVISERDMLIKVLTTSSSPDDILVKDIMTNEVVSCSMETTVAKAEQLMAKHKIRHLPILEDGVPVGMISSRDVMTCRLSSNEEMKTAAEQLAMLSTKLKNLDFNDVVELTLEEVPKSFEADWAILYFAQKDSSVPMIHRKGCPFPEKKLLEPELIEELSPSGRAICGEVCGECKKLDTQEPRLVIPLSVCEQSDDGDSGSMSGRGFLCMCRFNPSSPDSEELRLYKASLLKEILGVNLTNAKLYQDYQRARRDSEVDFLTGVGTRRVLNQVLKVEHARAIRYNRSFSVAIVDIDNLKEINDSEGHATGDMVLQQLAKTMTQTLRTMDVIARYGGDEFVLLMPETKLDEAVKLLKRLQRQIKTVSIPNVRAVTISCGVAEWFEATVDTAENVLRRADAALYEAKREGRNRIAASQTTVSAV